MTIKKNSARQCPNTAWVDINLADIAADVAAPAIELPVGAVVLSGQIITTEAWNSTTSDVMDLGDTASAARYLTDGNIRAMGARVPLVATGFVHTAANNTLAVRWPSGGGTPTTGKVRLEVTYYTQGRAEYSQG